MAVEKINPREGPTCACGKEDLYGVWLKQQEPGKEEDVNKVPEKSAPVISDKDEAICDHKNDD